MLCLSALLLDQLAWLFPLSIAVRGALRVASHRAEDRKAVRARRSVGLFLREAEPQTDRFGVGHWKNSVLN